MGNVLTVAQVNASGNDAHQSGNTTACTIGDATNPVGTNNTTDSPQEILAVRFTTVAVPQGASINAGVAQIKLCSNGDFITADANCFGEAADNSAIFTVGENLNTRARTTANVNCAENISRTAGVFYAFPSTGDFSPIIQEIVNRPGWVSGNAMSFIFVGSAAANFAHATIRMFDTSAQSGATLSFSFFSAKGGLQDAMSYVRVGQGMSRSELAS